MTILFNKCAILKLTIYKIYLGTLFVFYVYNYINKIKIQTLYNCKLHNMLKCYY